MNLRYINRTNIHKQRDQAAFPAGQAEGLSRASLAIRSVDKSS
jgi:hypothetical protein